MNTDGTTIDHNLPPATGTDPRIKGNDAGRQGGTNLPDKKTPGSGGLGSSTTEDEKNDFGASNEARRNPMPRGNKTKYSAKAKPPTGRNTSKTVRKTKASQRTKPRPAPGRQSTNSPAAASGPAVRDARNRPVQNRQIARNRHVGRWPLVRGTHVAARPTKETQTVDSLRKEARAKGIPGRSGMRKQELIEALRKAG